MLAGIKILFNLKHLNFLHYFRPNLGDHFINNDWSLQNDYLEKYATPIGWTYCENGKYNSNDEVNLRLHEALRISMKTID